MALEKPTKPTELVPRSFGGIKNNFSEDLQSTGFEPNMPQTYNGDNLNYQLDATGKELDYVEKIVDFINNAPVNNITYINENNQLDYIDKDEFGASFPMFSSFWSDHLYNNTSFLRADNFSWHYGSIYRAGYETLEEQYNHEKSVTEIKNGIKFKRTPDGFKIADASQHDAIRSLYENTGIAWFYIIDTELKRFKLPRTKWGFVGVRDEVGKPVEAGLPDIAFYGVTKMQGFGYLSGQSHTSEGVISASSQNPIYGNSNTVQPPATQMYLYFYVGKSKKRVEVDITEAVKIITPYFFGKSEYHKTEPNNPCLLKSQGQENYKTVYPDFYDWLLEERSNPNNLEPTCNVTKYGNVAETKGVLSGFNTTSYAEIPVYPTNMTSLEMHFKFTTGSEAETTTQAIFGNETANRDCPQLSSTGNDGYGQLGINFSKTGSAWDCILIAPYYSHKTYEFHCIWDGSTVSATLTDEDNVTTEMTILSGSTAIDQIYWGKKIRLGLDVSTSPFFGSIDLNESYINVNGFRWWTGANAVKEAGTTDVITDYDYVINTENETFILPLLNGSEDLPSDRYENLTLTTSGQTFTATQNGRFLLEVTATSANDCYISVENDTSKEVCQIYNDVGANYTSASAEARRGDRVTVNYRSCTVRRFRFLEFQGNGNLYYYVGNGVVNADLVDVATIETTKANRTDVDGRWIAKFLQLANNVTLTNSTGVLRYDLSNYLPNDGFDYEIKFSAVVTTGTASGDYINLYLKSDILPDNTGVTGARTRTTQNMSSTGNVDMPIGTQRYIEIASLSSANANGVFSLNANGYRRLGKNI